MIRFTAIKILNQPKEEMWQLKKQYHHLAEMVQTGIFIMALIFHVLVILEFVPNDIVWGGRITFKEELYIFESISIGINIFFLYVLLAYTKKIKTPIGEKFLKVLMWTMCVIFSLNTIGNLLAKTTTETIIFTPVTFISAVCCLVLLSREKS